MNSIYDIWFSNLDISNGVKLKLLGELMKTEKSGSLITVDYALEQGKEIFAVPRKFDFQKINWNK